MFIIIRPRMETCSGLFLFGRLLEALATGSQWLKLRVPGEVAVVRNRP